MQTPKKQIEATLPRITIEPDGDRWVAFLDRRGSIKRERIYPVERDWKVREPRAGGRQQRDERGAKNFEASAQRR